MALDQKANAAPSTDPVMQALSQGVDSIKVSSPPGPALQRRGERYHIVNGDVIDLQFQFTPDFNQTLTVEPDGYVVLKEVGDIHVEGETVPEIKQQVQDAYAKILANPVVTVDLKDFQKPYFLTLGQVSHPGKYDLRGATTVAEAVAMAGGFTQEAKHSQVLLFRRVDDRWSSVTKIDLKHMLKSRNLSEDLYLQPGDMVYVPQNVLSKVKSYIPTPSMGMFQPIP
jgi:polysaccharide biosynthesis/export protein